MAGPYGLGDPGAMRAEAQRLRRTAARLGGLAAEIDGRARSTDYEGPAAERFRSTMTVRRRRVERLAADLQRAVGLLESTAAQVEAEIRRRRVAEGRA